MALPVAVSRKRRLVIFDDDSTRPFGEMIGADGEETDDPGEAVMVVACEAADRWHVIDLREFDTVSTH